VQSNSGEMIQALAQFSREAGIVFQIHANEHTLEVHRSIEMYGLRPIEYLAKLGALGRTTLIAHATLATAHEINLLVDADCAVAYNPVATAWKGNSVAPALQYIERGIRVGLGSDATRNDGFRMLDAAESCQRIAYGLASDDFSCGAGWRWVHAATAGGAAAIGLEKVIGSLVPGACADFLILDCQGPEVNPSWDFCWELVRFYDRADLLATVVDGRPVYCREQWPGDGIEQFMARASRLGVAWIEDAQVVRLHGPSAEHRPLSQRRLK
jgi:5-methylthioadenosine/S-adenosylhomocysteine deaminase